MFFRKKVRENRGYSTHELIIRPFVKSARLNLFTVCQTEEKARSDPETVSRKTGWSGELNNKKWRILLDPDQPGNFLIYPGNSEKQLKMPVADRFLLEAQWYNCTGDSYSFIPR